MMTYKVPPICSTFYCSMTSFLTVLRLTTLTAKAAAAVCASGENWGQLILQPNHGAFVRHLRIVVAMHRGGEKNFRLAKTT